MQQNDMRIEGKKENIERNSSIELLRILLMLMIIASHYAVHGNYEQFTVGRLSWQVFLLQILSFGGEIANNAFVLITGYYMICSRLNYKRIFYLLVEMTFYAWVSVLAMFLFEGGITVSIVKGGIKACFPMFFGNSFAVGYLLLCTISPFLNNMLNNMEKEQFEKLLITLLLMWCIIPTVTLGVWGDYFGQLSGFIIMYILGAYIRIYGISGIVKSSKKCLILALSLLILFVVLMDILSLITGNDIFMQKIDFFAEEFSLFCVLPAISIFMVFEEKEFFAQWINSIAKSVFGIYLFHNSGIFLVLFFQKLFPNTLYIDSKWFLVHLLTKILGIFFAGLAVDGIRKLIVEKPLKKQLGKLFDRRWKIV